MKTARALLVGYRHEKVLNHLLDRMPEGTPARTLFIDDLLDNESSLLFIRNDGCLLVQHDEEFIVPPDAVIFHRFFVRKENDVRRQAKLFELYRQFASFIELMHPASLVINRPRAGAHNFAKMGHLNVLRRIGFKIPYAVQSTEPADLDPVEGEWINKGGSGIRTIAVPARRGSLPQRGRRMSPPTLVQSRIKGIDVRAHFVGLAHVSLSFTTDAVDYRYAEEGGFALETAPIDIEPALIPLCWEYMTKERLEFVGFDFKVTDDGQWYLLEANPMPGFSYFDRLVEFKISALIWESIARGFSNTGPSSIPNRAFIEEERRPAVDTGG